MVFEWVSIFIMKALNLHPESYKGTYKAVGGHLALDFVNTVSYRGTEKSHDWLSRFTNLSFWAKSLGLIDSQQETNANHWAQKNPYEANRLLEDVKHQRERLYQILYKIHTDEKCSTRDLKAFHKDLAYAFQRRELIQSDKGLRWDWRPGLSLGERIKSLTIESAFELMTSHETLTKMKACEGCDWLFLDRSQAKRRRWCTMEDCGNRAKARRFYKQKLQK